jgi:hypothetical protein
MTRTIAIGVLASLIATAANAAPGDHLWSEGWPVYGEGMDVDAAGRPSTAGSIWGAVDLGGGAIGEDGTGSIFAMKVNDGGGHVWSRAFANPSYASVTAVASSPDGDTYVAGNLSKGGSIEFDGILLSGPPGEAWAVRFDGSGNVLWGDTFGRGWIRDVDATDTEVAFTGTILGTMNFGGSDLGTFPSQVLAAKLTEDGNHVWSAEFGDAAYQSGLECGLTAGGSLVILSSIDSEADFGGGALAADADSDLALAFFNPSGGHVWSDIHHGTFGFSSILNTGLAVSGSGSIGVTGEFLGDVDFGGGTLNATSKDIFVVRFDSSGNHVWSLSTGGTGEEIGTGAAFDGSHNLYVAGTYSSPVDLGTGELPHQGSRDGFLLALDTGGDALWCQGFGSTGFESNLEVKTSTAGIPTVGLDGTASGIDFGGGVKTGTFYAVAYEGEAAPLSTPWAASSASARLFAAPNPFAAGTTLRLDADALVTDAGVDDEAAAVTILDVTGRRVRTYAALTVTALRQGITWDGRSDLGLDLAPGVYYVDVTVGATSLRSRVVRTR